jgi:hypothetical protein
VDEVDEAGKANEVDEAGEVEEKDLDTLWKEVLKTTKKRKSSHLWNAGKCQAAK